MDLFKWQLKVIFPTRDKLSQFHITLQHVCSVVWLDPNDVVGDHYTLLEM